MTFLLFLLQMLGFIFPHAEAGAYAAQIKSDVVVSVTYTERKPVTVCASLYELDDEDMKSPVKIECFKPTNTIGDLHTWKNTRLDFYNFGVSLLYVDGKVTHIYLRQKVNT